MSARAEATGSTQAVTPVLEVRDLEVAYTTEGHERTVLHGISFSIAPGERLAVVGESGSGKSTTAAALLGLLPGSGRVTGGSITFKGEDITRPGRERLLRLRGREVGLVPQDPMSNLNPVLRVGRQISETLAAHGVATGKAATQRAVELMEEAGIPDAARRARQYPHEFSGGMRQRVLIAIGLACAPELLVADEPTSALDVTVQRQILDHLETLRAARSTSLMLITHDLGLAADRADTVVVMSAGEIVEAGPTEQILRRPQHPYTQRLVEAAPSVSSARARVSVRQGEAPAGVQASGERASDTLLEAVGLTKRYRLRGQRGQEVVAVDDVSFRVGRGRTTAVVGESGSGKTTLSQLVLGLVAPTAGEVRIEGEVVETARGARRRAIRRAMQPVFQDPYASLDPTYSIEHIVDEPLRVARIGDRASRRRRVAELLDQVALPGSLAQRRPNELSGGQRQRVAIARALALEPRLVVCDEAVSALDVLVQEQTLDLLADLQDRLGLTYLFITHDLAVVRQLADDVLVMQGGTVVEEGAVEQVYAEPRTAYTRDLLDAIPGAEFFAEQAR
ncbi:dipeptide ABC transporter ATP-binding protein [Microlunatus flavus]|uniref:Peptide/nickel transport system ATP-binding protein n=1 Tax=Microlunatus flavus TaxID=1036181 RepID=A0A1H9MBE2_9ACTN|nr:ABC transporter ATP-binding protein [Microlunatus flavus]SER20952.1 peptide/nickel transport system ATP-binding protein [Microlunatus flavus]